ncbi:MAG: hypothetical protein GC154_00850 [bacterium]|nr:hypothetical protein [bacterium]
MISYIREEGFGRERSLLWLATAGLLVVFLFGRQQALLDRLITQDARQVMEQSFAVAVQGQALHPGVSPDPMWRWVLRRIADMGAIVDEMARISGLIGVALYALSALSLRSHFRRMQSLYADISVLWIVCVFFLSPTYGTSIPLTVFWMSLLIPCTASMRVPSMAAAVGVGVFSACLFLTRIESIFFIAALDAALLIQQTRNRGPHSIFGCIWAIQLITIGGYIAMVFTGGGESIYLFDYLINRNWLSLGSPQSLFAWLALFSVLIAAPLCATKTSIPWLAYAVILHCVFLVVWCPASKSLTDFALPAAAVSALAPEWANELIVFPHSVRIALMLFISTLAFGLSVYALV